MHGKIRFSRWLIAATGLALAECVSLALVPLPAVAQAQSSGDHLRHSRAHPRSDKSFQNLFGSLNWSRQQRKPHQTSHSSRTPQQKTRSIKPKQGAPTISEKPAAHSIGTAIAPVQNVPLPRPRPPAWAEPHSFAEAAGPDFDAADVTSAPSDCNWRLATITSIELLPRLIGPGACGSRDMIELNAVLLPDDRRIEVKPAGGLCAARWPNRLLPWLRDEGVSSHHLCLAPRSRGVETYGSHECRGRNGVPGCQTQRARKGQCRRRARLRSSADGRRIDLTDTTIAKPLRQELRDSACTIASGYSARGRAPIAITTTTSISTFLSEVMAIVFANGMCASRRQLELQARMCRCQIHDQLSPVGTEKRRPC